MNRLYMSRKNSSKSTKNISKKLNNESIIKIRMHGGAPKDISQDFNALTDPPAPSPPAPPEALLPLVRSPACEQRAPRRSSPSRRPSHCGG